MWRASWNLSSLLAPGVAGEDAEDHVEAEGDTEADDGAVVGRVLVKQEHGHGDQLERQVNQVHQDHALLSLSVGIFLIRGLQSGVVQATWMHNAFA